MVIKKLDRDYGIESGAIPKRFATTVNGIGATATAIVKALEGLTLRRDLRCTTMLPWSNVLSWVELLRPVRAWCPVCYEEWAKPPKIAYEPLIWSFQSVTVCTSHQRRLSSRCLHCDQEQRPLSASSRPGYCYQCRRWLGAPLSVSDPQVIDGPLTEAELAWQTWVIGTLGEMLAFVPQLELSPSKENFLKNLTSCMDQAAWGRISVFSSIVDIWSGTIRKLVKGEISPTLKVLLQICSRVEISLTAILSNTNGIRAHVLEKLRLHRMKSRNKRCMKIAWADVEKEMQEALTEYPPPSLSEITRRTGHNFARIKRNLPELSAQIIARYDEFIKEPVDNVKAQAVLHAALTETPAPSLQSILRRIGCRNTGAYYYDHFPDLCSAIAKRYKEHRNKPFNFDEVDTHLQAALVEQPPPAFIEVCRRLSFKRGFIRRKFPKLSRAIASQHIIYLKACREENKEVVFQEMEEAVRSIHADGLYVSEARVKDRLSRTKLSKLMKKAIHEAKRELGLGDRTALDKAKRG